MNTSFLKINKDNSNTLIVSFSSYATLFGGIPTFEFSNFLEKHFQDVSTHFYIDKYRNTYHRGIRDISKNIDETVDYLKEEITNYDNVIFLGTSAGGYAAILFGSLLNITSVVAFIPQTILHRQNIDEKYRDISKYINDTTNYYLYGDTRISNIKDVHHISHCERISGHSNVCVIKKYGLHLKEMRDNGELFTILNQLVNKKSVQI